MTRTAAVIFVAVPLLALGLLGPDAAARLLLAIGCPQAAAFVARDAMLSGQAFYASRHWGEAAAAFRQTGPRGSYNLGNALARAGKLREAVAAYDAALRDNPDDDDAAFNRELLARALNAATPVAGTAPPGETNAAATSKRSSEFEPDAGGGDAAATQGGLAGGRKAQSDAGASGGSKASQSGSGERNSKESGEGQARGSADDSEGIGRLGGATTGANLTPAFWKWERLGKSYETQSVLPTRQWLDTIPDDPGKYLKLRLAAEKARRVEAAAAAPGAVR